jgi:hypothetical protein
MQLNWLLSPVSTALQPMHIESEPLTSDAPCQWQQGAQHVNSWGNAFRGNMQSEICMQVRRTGQ